MTTPPGSGRFIWVAVIGMFVLALAGVALLAVALFTLTRPSSPVTPPSATPVFTQIAVIPTTTTVPPSDTPQPSDTPVPSETPTAPAGDASATQSDAQPSATTAGPGLEVTIVQPANVRTGPGLTYPVIAGLNNGTKVPLVGRDSSAAWFAISFEGGPGGVAWVSGQVAVYAGDTNALPVIQPAAPPPPAASATLPPTATKTNPPPGPTNTTGPQGARGIVANSFSIENTTVNPNEDIWFNFQVVNTSGQDVPYGALAAHTDAGFTAQSSTQEVFSPGESLTWRDHLNISASGNYQVYLGICFGEKNSCLAGTSPWDRISAFIQVKVN